MGKRNVEKSESFNGKKVKLIEGITLQSLVENDVTSETTLPGSNGNISIQHDFFQYP
jgi:hypothetical protein